MYIYILYDMISQMTNSLYITKKVSRSLCCIFSCISNFKEKNPIYTVTFIFIYFLIIYLKFCYFYFHLIFFKLGECYTP